MVVGADPVRAGFGGYCVGARQAWCCVRHPALVIRVAESSTAGAVGPGEEQVAASLAVERVVEFVFESVNVDLESDLLASAHVELGDARLDAVDLWQVDRRAAGQRQHGRLCYRVGADLHLVDSLGL